MRRMKTEPQLINFGEINEQRTAFIWDHKTTVKDFANKLIAIYIYGTDESLITQVTFLGILDKNQLISYETSGAVVFDEDISEGEYATLTISLVANKEETHVLIHALNTNGEYVSLSSDKTYICEIYVM